MLTILTKVVVVRPDEGNVETACPLRYCSDMGIARGEVGLGEQA